MIKIKEASILMIAVIMIAFVSCSAKKKTTAQTNTNNNTTISLDWQRADVQLSQQDLQNTNQRLPKEYDAYQVNNLTTLFNAYDKDNQQQLNVPINGKMLSFTMKNANTMSPELAAKYPEIKSLRGIAQDNSSATIDFNGKKLAMEIHHLGEIFIVQEYLFKGGTSYYLIYNKKNTGYEKVPFE